MSVSTRKDAELMEDGRKWRRYVRLMNARKYNPSFISLLFSIKVEIVTALCEMKAYNKETINLVSNIFDAYIEKLREDMK